MLLAVTRTGGLAGRTLSATLETSGHPDADHLRALATQALRDADAPGGPGAADGGSPDRGAPEASAAHPGPGRRGPVPDGFRYEITAGGATVRCSDPWLTKAQRELVRRVLSGGG